MNFLMLELDVCIIDIVQLVQLLFSPPYLWSGLLVLFLSCRANSPLLSRLIWFHFIFFSSLATQYLTKVKIRKFLPRNYMIFLFPSSNINWGKQNSFLAWSSVSWHLFVLTWFGGTGQFDWLSDSLTDWTDRLTWCSRHSIPLFDSNLKSDWLNRSWWTT